MNTTEISTLEGKRIEELLLPRYKVINIYPFNNHFMLNEIITLNEFDGRKHLTKELNEPYVLQKPLNPLSDILPITMYESTFTQYPHLFKKLEWWEDRKVEDMPEYLKMKQFNYVVKPIYHSENETYLFYLDPDCADQFLTDNFLPATLEEYTNYQKAQSKL